MFFINGQFWQKDEVLVAAQDPQQGLIPSLEPRSMEVMFHGFIGSDASGVVVPVNADGYITDCFGTAVVTDFALYCDQSMIHFKKQYEGRRYVIDYRFRRAVSERGGLVFVGSWQITVPGHDDLIFREGQATCMLTEISQRIFQVPNFREARSPQMGPTQP